MENDHQFHLSEKKSHLHVMVKVRKMQLRLCLWQKSKLLLAASNTRRELEFIIKEYGEDGVGGEESGMREQTKQGNDKQVSFMRYEFVKNDNSEEE